MRRMKNKGFTLIELLIVIVIIIALIVAAICFLRYAEDGARLAVCQVNMKAIGKSIGMYSAMSNDKYPFPLLAKYGNPDQKPLDEKHMNLLDESNVFSIADSAKGDNTMAMQNVWLLISNTLVNQSAFHCSPDTNWTDRGYYDAKKFGWAKMTEFSYGIQYPYDLTSTTNPANPSNPNCAAGLVIFADRNPGGSVTSGTTSVPRTPSNHVQDGETILRKDSTVTFYKNINDSKAGYGNPKKGIPKDDIYVNNAGVAGGLPQNSPASTLDGAWDTSITPSSRNGN